MKEMIKKIFTIFMVLTVLVSSHAFAYYEHICLITNQKTLSFEPKTCAGKSFIYEESLTPELKRAYCCELNLKVQKLENAQQNHLLAPNFVAFEGDFQNLSFDFSSIIFEKIKSIIFVSGISSPPKKKLFILFDQFLI